MSVFLRRFVKTAGAKSLQIESDLGVAYVVERLDDGFPLREDCVSVEEGNEAREAQWNWAWDAEQVTAISNTSMIFFIEQAVF